MAELSGYDRLYGLQRPKYLLFVAVQTKLADPLSCGHQFLTWTASWEALKKCKSMCLAPKDADLIVWGCTLGIGHFQVLLLCSQGPEPYKPI